MQSYIIILSTTLLCSVYCSSFPSNLKQCKRSALQDCLKDAIQDALPKLANGIPELNLPSIDPLFISSMKGDRGGVVDFEQVYNNVNIIGFSKAKIDKVSVTTSTATELNFVIDAVLDRVMLVADCAGKGLMLGVEFDGAGKCNITWENMKISSMTFSGKTIEKNGKKYMEFGKVPVSIGMDKLIIHVDGFFNGDEQKNQEMNALMNEHWAEISSDVNVQDEEEIGLIVQNIANGIFSQIPYDEIVPE